MAYLRLGEHLGFGRQSRDYVFGTGAEMRNDIKGKSIEYKEIDIIFRKYKGHEKRKEKLGEGLGLEGIELEIFYERIMGEWERRLMDMEIENERIPDEE